MGDDAYPPGGAPDGSVEHMRATQAPCRLSLAFGAELEAAGPPDDRDVRPARQPPDDFLADAVREVLQLRIARKIIEGQHRDGTLSGGGIDLRGIFDPGFATELGFRRLATAHGASTQDHADRRKDEADDCCECGDSAQQGLVPADPAQDSLKVRHAVASPWVAG